MTRYSMSAISAVLGIARRTAYYTGRARPGRQLGGRSPAADRSWAFAAGTLQSVVETVQALTAGTADPSGASRRGTVTPTGRDRTFTIQACDSGGVTGEDEAPDEYCT